MVQAGFSSLSDDALAGFETTLTDGVWSAVDAAEYLPRKGAKVKPLEEAPVLVFHKVMLVTSVQALVAALSTTSDAVKALDVTWDDEQRTLNLELQLRERAKNPAPLREAAARVRAVLLTDGTEQVNYLFDKEVEFGRTQVSKAGSKELAPDVATVGLVDQMKLIHEATEALAVGIHYDSLKKTERAPSRRALAAHRQAAAACNAAYESLSELVDRTPEGNPRRAQLVALKTTLDALLTRREAAAPVKAPVVSPATPPAAPPTGTNTPPTH